MEPCGTFVEPFWSLVEPLWNPRATLWNPLKPYLAPDHPTPLAERCNNGGTGRTLEELFHPAALAEPGGTLVEAWWRIVVEPLPWWNPGPGPPAALAEPWWNCGGTLTNHPRPPRSRRRTWWNPDETLVEPCLKPPVALSQNVVEPWWHPAALAEPGGKPGGTLPQTTPDPPLVELYLKPPKTIPQPLHNLVEPSWNPRLVEP